MQRTRGGLFVPDDYQVPSRIGGWEAVEQEDYRRSLALVRQERGRAAREINFAPISGGAPGGWVNLINWAAPEQTQTPTAHATFTAATDITSNQRGLQPGTLSVGTAIRWTAWGIYSTTATPTLALGLYYGGVAGTALAITAATTTGSAVSNLIWQLDAVSTVVATGNTSSALSIATAGQVVGIGATQSTNIMMPATSSSGNTVTSLDPTTLKSLTVGATWGTSSASNTITCYQFLVEALN